VEQVHHSYAWLGDAADDNILAYDEAAGTLAQIVPAPPKVWVLSQSPETAHEQIDETIGRSFTILRDVAPNFNQIAASSLAEPISRHQARVDFLIA
jgi:hypothetical protein